MLSVYFQGFFQFLGPIVFNIFQVSQVLLLLAWFVRSIGARGVSKQYGALLGISIVSVIAFLIGEIINHGNIIMALPFLLQIITPPLFVVSLDSSIHTQDKLQQYATFVRSLLVFHILAYIVKYLMFGVSEALAGTTSLADGGPAALFPIVVMMFAFLTKRTGYVKSNTLLISLSFIVPLVGGKRATWFFFPISLLLYAIFVTKKIKMSHIFAYAWIVPIVLYLGIRLSPTLNEEKKVWGEFTPEYTYSYVFDYNYGRESVREAGNRGGRMGVNQAVIESVDFSNINSLFGYGLNSFRGSYWEKDISMFSLEGIQDRSQFAGTGFSKRFLTQGIIGVALMIAVYIMITGISHDKGVMRFMLILLLMIGYTYADLLYASQALMTVFFFSMIYSNKHINPTFARNA
ncbi:MAG: hypothetical protein PHI24_07005 [Desulfitobacteriaceae bacterium]|jgi:hypothetical protein|nr:hypothetical protein [Desulfitobacteriaceae bacterium]